MIEMPPGIDGDFSFRGRMLRLAASLASSNEEYQKMRYLLSRVLYDLGLQLRRQAEQFDSEPKKDT